MIRSLRYPFALCLVFAFAGVAFAQEEKKAVIKPSLKPAEKAPEKGPGDKAAAPSPEEIKMMEAWKGAAALGEPHAKLKAMAGSWNVSTKWRMTPEQPWDGSKGTAEYRPILGGRVLLQEIKAEPGSSMDAMMGYPFEGFGLSGYDNVTKQYWSAWSDNMGTGLMTSHGTADGSGKTITYTGSYDDPIRGKVTAKSTLKIEGNDKMIFEMYDKGPDGKEFTSLEVTYTRKK